MQKDSGEKPAKKGRIRRWTRKDGTEVEKDYGVWVPKPDSKPKPLVFGQGDTVADLVDRFELTRESKNQKPRTRERYTLTFRRLRDAIGKVPLVKVKRINLLEVRDAIGDLHGDGAAWNWAKTVTKLFNFAMKNGLIAINPAIDLMEGVTLGELQPWTRDEIDLALAHLPEYLRRVVLLGMNTGQRKGDLIAMRWTQFDGRYLSVTQEKTEEPLRIPVSAAFKVELDRWRVERVTALQGGNVVRLVGNEHILLNAYDKPWTSNGIVQALRRTLRRIDGFPMKQNRHKTDLIPARSLHGLRYYLCAALAAAGCTPHQIMAISGHKTLSMVQKYCRMYDKTGSGEVAIAKWVAAQGEARRT